MKNDEMPTNDPSRRKIIHWTGIGGAIAILGIGLPNFGISKALAADLGSGDIGILNYAYALEQLEAAFYQRVLKSPYRHISEREKNILSEIYEHEVEHRDFLQNALGDRAIGKLKVDFSPVDFTKRSSVLKTARTFEDLGVSAYNGAGRLLKSTNYLNVAGKIVSVEARHAATIRDLLQPLSSAFAGSDVVDSNGLDKARRPSAVLQVAKPFIKTPVSANSF